MTTFWIFAVVMMLLAMVLALFPLFMKHKHAGQEQKQLNIAIFKQRMQELQREKEDGLIEDDQYDLACKELERSLLMDVSDGSVHAVEVKEQSARSKFATIITTIILIPAMAIPLYLHFGSIALVDAKPVEQQAESDSGSMQEAVAMLVQKMEQEPDNIEGWVLLAKSYLVLGRVDDAVRAYDKAYTLNPQDPDVMIDYAEVLARANDGDISGKPLGMIRMALALEPSHPKGLWILGIISFNDGDFATAILQWEKLQSTLEVGSEDFVYLQNKIDDARTKLAGGSEVVQPSPERVASNTVQDGVFAGVNVVVSMDKSLAGEVQAEDTVFIFAQAVNGPRMPMAALRVQVKDLPLTAVLDDSTAMGPMARISSVDKVTISARVSKSGTATASSGDIQGTAGPATVGSPEPVAIVIDQIIP